MWEIKHSVESRSTKEIVWNIWKDVEHWNKWDVEVEWSKLEGDFSAGTKGKLKPKGGPVVNFEVCVVEPENRFIDRASLPLTKLEFIHEISSTENGVYITHKVRMTGILTIIFSRLMGRKIQQGLPQAVKNLATLAEQRYNQMT